MTYAPENFRDEIARRYQTSADGVVRSTYRNRAGMPMQTYRDRDGYPILSLHLGGKNRQVAVHRLVALFYLPPRPSPDHEIRHLDGDKENSAASNLAWGTRKENADDRDRHGRTARGESHYLFGNGDRIRGEANPSAKLNNAAVARIRELAAEGATNKALAQAFGVSAFAIWEVVSGRSWVPNHQGLGASPLRAGAR